MSKNKGNLTETADVQERLDDAVVKAMNRQELDKYLDESTRKLAKLTKKRNAAVKKKDQSPDKPELIIDCLSAQKLVIDEMCDNLVAVCQISYKKLARQIKSLMLPELDRYNALADEYFSKTGSTLTHASLTIPDDIIAGKEYMILPLLSYTVQSAEDVEAEKTATVVTMSHRQFLKFVDDTDKAMEKVSAKYREAYSNIGKTEGQDKVIMILTAMSLKKQLVDSTTEVVVAARQADGNDLGVAKKHLDKEVKDYNALVDQYCRMTGATLTKASETYVDDVAAGRPYTALPVISYSVTDAQEGDEVDCYEVAKRRMNSKKETDKKTVLSALEAKVAEQANKDLLLITSASEFQISLLESERDMCHYRYGAPTKATKERRQEIAHEIAAIKEKHKVALHYEEMDNQRYYAVVTSDPETMAVSKRNVDRARLASLRSRLITLLNKRDELNGKLISIYTGSEINSDGTSVNQVYRRIKSEAADALVKRDRRLAKQVASLNATPAEIQRIFDVMNKKLDAGSTLAVCEYRLEKENLSPEISRQLKKDAQTCRDIMHRCDSDVDFMVKRIKKSGSGGGKGWIVSLVLFLIVIGAGVGAFLALFGQGIL